MAKRVPDIRIQDNQTKARVLPWMKTLGVGTVTAAARVLIERGMTVPVHGETQPKPGRPVRRRARGRRAEVRTGDQVGTHLDVTA